MLDYAFSSSSFTQVTGMKRLYFPTIASALLPSALRSRTTCGGVKVLLRVKYCVERSRPKDIFFDALPLRVTEIYRRYLVRNELRLCPLVWTQPWGVRWGES